MHAELRRRMESLEIPRMMIKSLESRTCLVVPQISVQIFICNLVAWLVKMRAASDLCPVFTSRTIMLSYEDIIGKTRRDRKHSSSFECYNSYDFRNITIQTCQLLLGVCFRWLLPTHGVLNRHKIEHVAWDEFHETSSCGQFMLIRWMQKFQTESKQVTQNSNQMVACLT